MLWAANDAEEHGGLAPGAVPKDPLTLKEIMAKQDGDALGADVKVAMAGSENWKELEAVKATSAS